ncbi:MAG: glutathione S-transferase N-terminal domain-containing protein, partial [Oceanococcaceae bacterium]
MKLYYTPGTCSLAVHILLQDSGLPHSLEKVDSASKSTASGQDYWTINPKGVVPLLELEDGQRLSEGPVIAQYIADLAGRTDLMPAPGDPRRY